MLFGELPADCQLPVADAIHQLSNCSDQAVGCFIYYYGSGLIFELIYNNCTLFFIPWQKGFKCKSSGWSARHGKCRDTCRRSRKGCDRNAFLIADSDYILAGVRNARCSGICYKCYVFAFLELCHKLIGLFYLVKLMIACHGCLYVKMIQKLYRVSRVLCRYQIHLFERF